MVHDDLLTYSINVSVIKIPQIVAFVNLWLTTIEEVITVVKRDVVWN